jgi:putative DNA primase/helicase
MSSCIPPEPQARAPSPDTAPPAPVDSDEDDGSVITVTLFPDSAAQAKREETLRLHNLANRIATTSASSKSELPWLKLATFGNIRTERGSLRHNGNVLSITGIEGDYDGEQIGFDAARQALQDAGVEAIVYASPSHTEDAPRWRVLCPFDAPHRPEERDKFMARLNGLFSGAFSVESWTLSQSYYYGSINQSPSHRVELIDGTFIDLLDHLDNTAIGRPEKPKPSGGNGPPTRPKGISDARIRGLLEALLDRVRNAQDGAKHHTLRATARTIGGYLHLTEWTESEAIEQLMAALPASVEDWESARRTAAWGISEGTAQPLELEDRPNPYGGQKLIGPPAPEPPPPEPAPDWASPTDEPPVIMVRSGQRHLAADAGIAAMTAAGVAFYQRDKTLVRVCRISAKASDGTLVSVPAVAQVSNAMLGRALGQAAHWQRLKATGKTSRIDPPREVVDQIAAMAGEWPFPPLYGVISTPTMRPDGSLLATDGYDPATGFVLLASPAMPKIPERPTKQDALDALATLNALLVDFPFANEPSRSVAMSMLMTPVLRAALPPAVPAHLTSAPEAGTGKSYLQDISAAIAIGDRCPVMSVSSSAEETEKRLIGAALAQFPIIALDNVSVLLMGDFLCQVTERPVLQIRPLGSSNMSRIANTFTPFANGNNLTVGADFVRRTLQCSLDAQLENPETREFSSDPVATVLADRGKYIAAILTIARAYVVAGRPGRLPQRASYQGWSDTVRSALVWLNWPDPVDSLAGIQAADPIRQQRAAVFAAWSEELIPNVGYQTRELIHQAEEYNLSDRAKPALFAALFAVAASHTGHPQIDPKRLGQWLLRNVNTIARGYKLLVDRGDAARPRWKLTAA